MPDRRENRIRLRNHFRGTEAHQKCIAVRRIKVRRCLQRESGESFGIVGDVHLELTCQLPGAPLPISWSSPWCLAMTWKEMGIGHFG